MQKLRIANLQTGMVLNEINLAKNNLISAEEFRAIHEGDEIIYLKGEAVVRTGKLLVPFHANAFRILNDFTLSPEEIPQEHYRDTQGQAEIEAAALYESQLFPWPLEFPDSVGA